METTIATDYAANTDWSAYAIRRPGSRLVVVVPRELGAVTALDVRGGTLIAKTESGIPLICPRIKP